MHTKGNKIRFPTWFIFELSFLMESGCFSPTWQPVVSHSLHLLGEHLCPTCMLQWSCLCSLTPNSSPNPFPLPLMLLCLIPSLLNRISFSPIPESSSSPPFQSSPLVFGVLPSFTLEPDSPLSTPTTTVLLHWEVSDHLHLSPADAVNCVLYTLPHSCVAVNCLLLRLCTFFGQPHMGTEPHISQVGYKKNPQRYGGGILIRGLSEISSLQR